MITKSYGIMVRIVLIALSSSVASADEQPVRPRGQLSGRVSPDRIPDLVAYRTGLRLVGSMPTDQQLPLLKAMLREADLTVRQLQKIAQRATQLHRRLVSDDGAGRRSRRGSRDATVLAMRQLERDIGRGGVQQLSLALKAVVKPNIDIDPLAGFSALGARQ